MKSLSSNSSPNGPAGGTAGDALVSTYRSKPNLDVVADPVSSNPNHASETGWPSADDETAQIMIAEEVAAVAKFVPPPEAGQP